MGDFHVQLVGGLPKKKKEKKGRKKERHRGEVVVEPSRWLLGRGSCVA